MAGSGLNREPLDSLSTSNPFELSASPSRPSDSLFARPSLCFGFSAEQLGCPGSIVVKGKPARACSSGAENGSNPNNMGAEKVSN